tara:strand:- start:9191 stop:9904 length:714 start_codon:yes stop_codon:yes gene_type:complete
MAIYKVVKVKTKNDLASRASEQIISIIQASLLQKERVQIALSGGSTPSAIYKLLSKVDIPWHRVDVFLGDERWVDSRDESSNSLMLRNTLLANYPGSFACFHFVPTIELLNPESSAEYFQRILDQKCSGSPPVFDLMLLGLGEDGHTASLFPYTTSLDITDKWATICSGKGQQRISLTHPVLSASKNVLFLVSGKSKHIALQRLLDTNESPKRTPAKLVQPSSEILVIADEDAITCL